MVLFSKGMGLKNDVFCLISFLTPLDVSKTSTNIWKHLGIFQNPSEDSKNTKIGLFDQILASVKCTYPCKWGLKYQIFAYFSTFFHFLWPMDLYTCGIESGHHNTLLGAQPVPFWSQGTDFIPENGHNLL